MSIEDIRFTMGDVLAGLIGVNRKDLWEIGEMHLQMALAKELDVNILYVPLPEKIRGILVRVLRKKTILLNDKLNYEAQKIVICHELGHVRMHWHAGYFFQHEGIYYSPARYECEANEFAIHLLNYSSDFIYDKDYILEVLAKENPNPYEVHKIINALMQIESI